MPYRSADTVNKMVLTTGAGIGFSFSDIESALRIISLLVTLGLTLYVFIRDEIKRRKNKKQED